MCTLTSHSRTPNRRRHTQQTGKEREDGAAYCQGGEPDYRGDLRIPGDATRQEVEGRAHEACGEEHLQGIQAKNEEAELLARQAAHQTGISRV